MAKSCARNLALWCAISAVACASQEPPTGAGAADSAASTATSGRSTAGAASARVESTAEHPVDVSTTSAADASSSPLNFEQLYQTHLAEQHDLEFSGLERALSLKRQPDAPLSFNPTTARYAGAALNKLLLTQEERAAFQRDGVVNVDHRQRYSMASAYYGIFTRDLPVLVTTDSILHALHRSYDAILAQLETTTFTRTLAVTLEKSQESLRQARATTPKLEASYSDVDLYLTVARNLLASEGAPQPLPVTSLFGNDEKVKSILSKIALLQLELQPSGSGLYGGARPVDYSQFKPRGHYSESPELRRYFRAMMWLGRADTGFVIAPPDELTAIRADAERELRSASLLAMAVEQSGMREPFEAMGRTIDFLVGSSDNLTIGQLLNGLRDVKIRDAKALESTEAILALQRQLAQLAHQQIRSQVLVPPREAEKEAPTPEVFQLFGQRFSIDSYLLSKVVYDSIWFRGKKVERTLPSGLDVMAALGNDEATRLLRPELERFNYSSNLLAARRAVEEIRTEQFEQNVASLWLDSLRKLADVPTRGSFPQAMRRMPFQRKQLQTQLASWAELRHDTALYGKQSYSAGITCQYPEGYVEPYPEFFARLALLADHAGDRLGSSGDDYIKRFFSNFSVTMKFLERLAQKELDSKPFTEDERTFLKQTIDQSGRGCGPPTYDGWYTRLIYGGDPQLWKPTVSDVHTDPTTRRVLQEAVGDVNYFVVAVDNQHDRAVYVGPVYSYYEFTSVASDRLTDEQWRELITRGAVPARPAWWRSAFPAKPLERELASSGTRERSRVAASARLFEKLKVARGQERERVTRELLDLESGSRRLPATPPN